eukprot:248091-Chlamydomonas_euryale.AAC.1
MAKCVPNSVALLVCVKKAGDAVAGACARVGGSRGRCSVSFLRLNDGRRPAPLDVVAPSSPRCLLRS